MSNTAPISLQFHEHNSLILYDSLRLLLLLTAGLFISFEFEMINSNMLLVYITNNIRFSYYI